MKVCFLMYPWDCIDPETDSTLQLIHKAANRRMTVALTTAHNLTIRDTVPYAFCNVLKKTDKVSSNVPAFYKNAEFKRCKLPLAGFDAIIMRANPPLDTTALNFLDSVRNDVFIMNDLDGLRIANNKLYPASFSGDAARFIPATHVSKSQEYLEQVLEESNTERMIMKPLNAEQAIARFRQAAEHWGMPCKVEKSSKLAAAAMVLNHKKTVQISTSLQMTEQEIRALINHELGVHMATTLNASQQRLKVFTLGLPGNTYAQEGLAILNEFQSGNLSLKRLKVLALRVLAVREMISRNDFRHTFSFLHEEHNLTKNEAFNLAVRVHRGGGFTKDYLYLSGVSTALELVQQYSLDNLYVGKTGFEYLDIINELVARQWVTAPKYCPEYLNQPAESPPVLSYLMACIKPGISPAGMSEKLSPAA